MSFLSLEPTPVRCHGIPSPNTSQMVVSEFSMNRVGTRCGASGLRGTAALPGSWSPSVIG